MRSLPSFPRRAVHIVCEREREHTRPAIYRRRKERVCPLGRSLRRAVLIRDVSPLFMRDRRRGNAGPARLHGNSNSLRCGSIFGQPTPLWGVSPCESSLHAIHTLCAEKLFVDFRFLFTCKDGEDRLEKKTTTTRYFYNFFMISSI